MRYTLRALRERAGYTQKEVAKEIGVSENTIRNLERDSTHIKDLYTKSFMKLYDVDYDDIFLGKEHRISVPYETT